MFTLLVELHDKLCLAVCLNKIFDLIGQYFSVTFRRSINFLKIGIDRYFAAVTFELPVFKID